MPLRATDNPLVLPLLGLLLEQPRHPYALLTELRGRYRHLRVRTGSVYTLVGSLQEVDWIEPVDHKTGTVEKPHTDFRLTPTGVAEFCNKVSNDLEDANPANAMSFLTALAYISILNRQDAAATLQRRIDALSNAPMNWNKPSTPRRPCQCAWWKSPTPYRRPATTSPGSTTS